MPITEMCERCQEDPSEGLLHGIALFNAQEYFECHEVLEDIWNAERHPIRTIYKGIIQVGVGCYHLLRGNYRGATIKLQTGADYLEPYAPVCFDFDIAGLIAATRTLRVAVVDAGPDNTTLVDRSLLPKINRLKANDYAPADRQQSSPPDMQIADEDRRDAST